MNRSTKNIALTILSAILLLTSTFLFNSCCNCGAGNASDVPLSILVKSNDFIINKTGKDFFNKYITPEFGLIKYQPPYYKMAYRFFMPEKPFVDEIINFTVDSLGNVDTSYEISGIPDYKANPGSCNFLLNEKEVIQSAQKYGLEEGVISWKIGLVWDATLNRYAWHVLSTLSQSGVGKDYKGNGKELVIDPGTGKILAVNYWHIP
jgi:hypothetical protein